MDMAFLKMGGFVKFYSRLYNIAANLIRVIGNFYGPCHQCSLPQSQRKRRSESDTKGRLLPPTLFKMLLKRIMNDALEDHKGTVSIGDRTITERLPMTWMTWQETRRN